MENSDNGFNDSPKKKKRKTTKSKVNVLRECIIHVRDDGLSDHVSPFTNKSWKVTFH